MKLQIRLATCLFCAILLTSVSEASESDVRSIADRASDKSRLVFTSGWEKAEITQILEDFVDLYPDDRETVTSYEMVLAENGLFLIHFSSALNPSTFQFLVNYFHYPHRYDLSARVVVAVGLVELDETFESSMSGMGVFYVPENDQEFDEVYAKTEFDEIFRISFTNHFWVPKSESRAPPLVDKVLSWSK